MPLSCGVWAKGLWPHSYSLSSAVSLDNGMSVYRYQVTNIGSSLKIGTFCHENGHMLCGFPDIYDYDYDSKGGAGVFCLMNSGGSGGNPNQVCAYLKLAAGWTTATDIEGTSTQTLSLVAAPNKGYDKVYRYRKPNVPKEYFLLENRQKTGRDANLPASGIAIWHVDEQGDKDEQSMTPNTTHTNYECTLVQADNLWHFQNNKNSGDASDLYYQGNKASAYTNTFNDTSTPNAHWWDGTNSKLNLSSFSASAMTMTVTVNGTDTATKAAITSPANGSTLSGASVTFTRNAGVNVTAYELLVGTSEGGSQIYSGKMSSTTLTVTKLPTNGSKVYVRLGSQIAGAWQYNDYSYIASNGSSGAVADGTYALKSVFSGKYADINSASIWSGATLVQWSWTGGTNQKFEVTSVGNDYYSIKPKHSGLALSGGTSSGEIIQTSYTGANDQQWKFTSIGGGKYTITCRSNNLLMDLFYFSMEDDTTIGVWSANNGTNQQWELIKQ